MKTYTEYLSFETQKKRDYINITPQVEAAVAKSGVREGLCLVNPMHITASIYINDDEDGLIQDFDDFLEKIARFQYYVFSLGKEFKLIDELQSGDLNYDASFKDVDGDGKFEFLTEDQHFGYWHSSFAGAPMPVIILKYKNGHYRLAMDLMRKPLPTAKEEKRIVQKIKKEILDYRSGKKVSSFAGDPSMGVWKDVILSPLVWGQMLDLIYSGHAEAAWKFLHEVWPQGKSGEKQFLFEFKKELAKDPYWELLKEGQVIKGSL